MSSLKYRIMAVVLVAFFVVMGMSAANAEWISPVGVYDNSPVYSDGLELSIDGNQGTYAKIKWDGTIEDGLPGYVVYDLGSVVDVSGFRFMPRIHPTADTGPEDISIFNYTDESLMPSGGPEGGYDPNDTSTLAADTNVNYLVSATLPPMHGAGDYADVTFSQTQARYIGIRCYTSYDGDWENGGMNTFAEVSFNVVPEPSSFALLGIGIISLVCYARWKRK